MGEEGGNDWNELDLQTIVDDPGASGYMNVNWKNRTYAMIFDILMVTYLS